MKDISPEKLIELAINLAKNISGPDRYERLLESVRRAIECDAVVLLKVRDGCLVPLAISGLSLDTLGRRFDISAHPRFEAICQSRTPVRFSSDSSLPDPYDGLLLSREGDLPVHACMGLPLYFNDELIGVLTVDSLTPNIFDHIPNQTLNVVSVMAESCLNTALLIESLELQARLSEQVVAEIGQSGRLEMIGSSLPMLKLKQEISLVSPSDFTILIQGETGVGKELVAREIHVQSVRTKGPLVHVNCAALPDNLIESELFGHVKGAFTGAEQARSGKFVIAQGGTLFLDEIGELPLTAQSKLLRVLQNKEIQPVGQDTVIHVDVRVIAATNRDLASEVKKGTFRADLYHRLSVYPVGVPALRDREGDIALLSGFFIERISRRLGISQLKMSLELSMSLTTYDWPGNVRELENLINRAALKARSRQRDKEVIVIESIDCETLASDNAHTLESNNIDWKNREPEPDPVDDLSSKLYAVDHNDSMREAVDNFQRHLILTTLQQEDGNWAATAKKLSLDRANLNRLARRLNIKIVKSIKVIE